MNSLLLGLNCSTYRTDKEEEENEWGRGGEGKGGATKKKEDGKNRRNRKWWGGLKQENSFKRKCKNVIKKARSRQRTDAEIIRIWIRKRSFWRLYQKILHNYMRNVSKDRKSKTNKINTLGNTMKTVSGRLMCNCHNLQTRKPESRSVERTQTETSEAKEWLATCGWQHQAHDIWLSEREQSKHLRQYWDCSKNVERHQKTSKGFSRNQARQ